MNFIADFLNSVFGLRSMPWIMRVYLGLLLICVGLLVYSASYAPTPADVEHPMSKLFNLGNDSFKVVLGAVIGSLSMAATATWQPKEGASDTTKPEAPAN